MREAAVWLGVGANVIIAVAYFGLGIYVAPKFNLSTMPSTLSRIANLSASALFIGTGVLTFTRAWFMLHPMPVPWTLRPGAILFFVVQAVFALVFFMLASKHLHVKVFDRKAFERILDEYLAELDSLSPPVNQIDTDNPEHLAWIALIDEAIHGDIMETVFQPIVNIATGKTVGYEALTRFHHHDHLTTEQWFIGASRFNLARNLEVAAALKAIERINHFNPGLYLAINVSQDTFLSLDLVEAIAERGPYAHRYVLELTEHIATVRYKPLKDTADMVRHMGIRIAVDDLGSGFASMRRILELRPEMIKLDRSLSLDIATNEHQQSLVRSLVRYAQEMNVIAVVEGVETAEQAQVLRDLGVRFAQGYYFGRPEPLPRP